MHPLVASTALALIASCTLHTASSFGGGARTTSASPLPPSDTSSTQSLPATQTENGVLTRRYEKLPPYPTAPQDPWLGVANDQPRRIAVPPNEMWVVRSNDHACTAAVDHCFIPEAWFVEEDASARRAAIRTGYVIGFGPEGVTRPFNARTSAGLPSEPFIAYRTVPATRNNLVPKAIVTALSFDKPTIDRGAEVFERTWYVGVVESVDWELGLVFFVGQPDRVYSIAGTRVAVLSWRPGTKVAIVGDRARGDLAVRAADVTLPPAR